MSASLAAPSTGGAVSLILSAPSSVMVIPFLEARGWIRTLTTAWLSASRAGGLFGFPFTAALLETDQFEVHLQGLLDILHEVVLLAPKLQEL